MMLHVGERVFWGAPEVIYLEGEIVSLDPTSQTATVHVDRATPYSAHLIDTDVTFAADGVTPLRGDSPPGTTNQRSSERRPLPQMNDAEKVRSTAATAVHQKYGYMLPKEQEQELIDQVAQTLESDPAIKARIISSMNEILKREW
jgi:hypothetical protein